MAFSGEQYGKGQQWSLLGFTGKQYSFQEESGLQGQKCDWQQGKWVRTQEGHGFSLTVHQSTKALHYGKLMQKAKSMTTKD